MEQASPPIEAVVAVLRRGDRFLVIQRSHEVISPGYWAPPSGRIEAEETGEQAVVREVAEELGLEATPLTKVWECSSDDGAFRLHWWTAMVGSGEGRLDPSEVAETRWVTVNEFMELRPTFAGDREFFLRVFPMLD
jgi:8-oxo-dGTP pyrophosphatase MutT (NUDIX family)